jgi:hypothetical protein
MSSNRILQLNAASTAACGIGMLAARGILPNLFGLSGPILLDIIAVGLLVYAVLLAAAARRRPVPREALIALTVADVLWVAASAVVLLVFWNDFAAIARFLVIAVAVVVEMFATLQFRAAGHIDRAPLQTA